MTHWKGKPHFLIKSCNIANFRIFTPETMIKWNDPYVKMEQRVYAEDYYFLEEHSDLEYTVHTHMLIVSILMINFEAKVAGWAQFSLRDICPGGHIYCDFGFVP